MRFELAGIPDEALQELELDVGDAVYLIEEFVGNTRCLVLSKKPQIADRIDELTEAWDSIPPPRRTLYQPHTQYRTLKISTQRHSIGQSQQGSDWADAIKHSEPNIPAVSPAAHALAHCFRCIGLRITETIEAKNSPFKRCMESVDQKIRSLD
ncbi:hypothetical protein D3C84_432470 [compost metagenome]